MKVNEILIEDAEDGIIDDDFLSKIMAAGQRDAEQRYKEKWEKFDPHNYHDLAKPKNAEVEAVTKVNRLVEVIRRNCAEMVSAYQQTGKVLYRGLTGTENAQSIITRIRQDRQPIQMGRFHESLHLAFEKLGIPATRKNSIFCSAQKDTAGSWGWPYVIFVKDGWSGTIFPNESRNSYAFATLQLLAAQCKYNMSYESEIDVDKLAGEIKKLNPTVFSTAPELSDILTKLYKDVMVTGDSYIALKADGPVCRHVLKQLSIR